jgi:hypothetical protein
VFTRKGNVGSNPTLSASSKRLNDYQNQSKPFQARSAMIATLEFACLSSSVTTSP